MISIQTDEDGRIIAACEGDGYLTDGFTVEKPPEFNIEEIDKWTYKGEWTNDN